MAEWPTRGQQSPNYWDVQLKEYVDAINNLIVVDGDTVTLTGPVGATRGYLVESETDFTDGTLTSSLAPGVYTFVHTSIGWKGYPAAGGVALGSAADTTPPSAITDLVATGGEETISANWADQTDAESPVEYKYRVWLSSGGATGPWTTTATSGFGPLAIDAGVYTVEAYAFSSGGASAIDTAIATVTAPVVTPRSIKLSRDPLYYWPLDDDAGTTNPVNLGSGGGTAVKVGSVTFGAAGILGTTSSALFSGGWITMPLAANLNGLSEFTVEVMVRADDTPSGDIINGGGDYNDSYDIGVGYYIVEGDLKYHGGEPSSYTPGKLYGMTYDGTNMRFYVNGPLVHTGAHTGVIDSSAAGAIGARGSATSAFAGRIAEVVIYTTCLDDAAMLATAQAHGLA